MMQRKLKSKDSKRLARPAPADNKNESQAHLTLMLNYCAIDPSHLEVAVLSIGLCLIRWAVESDCSHKFC